MDVFKILLSLHIVTGGLSLILGACILGIKKGGQLHVKLGNVYFYSLLISAMIALLLSYLHPNYFLFIIGVFTSYILMSGKRYLAKKSPADVTNLDWALSFIMLVFGVAFIGFGMYNIVRSNFFGIVFIVFGLISLFFVYQDNRNFRGMSPIKNFGLTTHLQRMIASYIASFTAFLVVNNTILPGIIAWLLPTIITVPMIIKWTRKYKVVVRKQVIGN